MTTRHVPRLQAFPGRKDGRVQCASANRHTGGCGNPIRSVYVRGMTAFASEQASVSRRNMDLYWRSTMSTFSSDVPHRLQSQSQSCVCSTCRMCEGTWTYEKSIFLHIILTQMLTSLSDTESHSENKLVSCVPGAGVICVTLNSKCRVTSPFSRWITVLNNFGLVLMRHCSVFLNLRLKLCWCDTVDK